MEKLKPASEEDLIQWLQYAADIMRVLPGEHNKSYFFVYPEALDKLKEKGFFQATPEDIARMEEILSWLSYTNVPRRKILWMTACRLPQKVIATKLRLGRSTLWREKKLGVEDVLRGIKGIDKLTK